MTKKEVIKGAVKVALCCGCSTIVGNIVQFTSSAAPMGVTKGLCVNLSSFVLSSMLTEKAWEYADLKIDQLEAELKKMSEEDKNAVQK